MLPWITRSVSALVFHVLDERAQLGQDLTSVRVPMIIGLPLLLLSKRVGQLLDAMPTAWLVALQLYRVFGSQWLVYWLGGLLPGLWALPAGTGDVLPLFRRR